MPNSSFHLFLIHCIQVSALKLLVFIRILPDLAKILDFQPLVVLMSIVKINITYIQRSSFHSSRFYTEHNCNFIHSSSAIQYKNLVISRLYDFFSTDIKPNYRTSIWAKGSRGTTDVFASATDDQYTVNDLQLKRERKRGDCRLIYDFRTTVQVLSNHPVDLINLKVPSVII